MTGADALARAAARLSAAGVPQAGRDARILLAHVLDIERSRLTLVSEETLLAQAEAAFEAAVRAREQRQPVSQIIGTREFFGRAFHVTPDVLDPRPDTERLIEVALEAEFASVLDLGTGSGCILLTLVAENATVRGVGTDISTAALAVARRNAEKMGLYGRVAFQTATWFCEVSGQFDLIVANPPYIAAAEMAALEPEVRDWEPRFALTPEGDGLEAYRVLAAGAAAHLAPGGRLIVEIGPTQAKAVISLMQNAGFATRVLQDLDGRDRVIEAHRIG